MSNTVQVDTKSFVKDLLARSGHTFVQSFIATLVTLYAASGLDVSSLLSLSGLGKFYTTVVVAAAAAFISLAKTTIIAFTKTSQGKADTHKVEGDVFGRLTEALNPPSIPVAIEPDPVPVPSHVVPIVDISVPTPAEVSTVLPALDVPVAAPALPGEVPVPTETPVSVEVPTAPAPETTAPVEVPAVEVPAVVVPNPAEQTQTLDEVIAAGA